ncbi:MAG TPA: FAD-binding oxidoreductase, partial [Planctomycetaceae bacterium]|nr:FAD-binding oxidoreductase [Planctomycetaceae bacterium]
PGVGATGVTLGGGLGWLSGLFGACCDSLVSARVVSADGTLREADDEHDPDLAWALRGAGANFGIAT